MDFCLLSVNYLVLCPTLLGTLMLVFIHSISWLVADMCTVYTFDENDYLSNLRKREQEMIDFKNIMFLKMDNFHHKISDNMHICSGVMLNNTMVSSRLLLKNRLSFFITHQLRSVEKYTTIVNCQSLCIYIYFNLNHNFILSNYGVSFS